MKKYFFRKILILLLGAIVLPWQICFAELPGETTSVVVAQDEILSLQKYLLWQKINEARSNPQAVLERLEISLDQAQAAFGNDAWVLDQGLLPVAWNDCLHQATFAHGRDMIDNLFYSHFSSDGSDLLVRIASTGYQPVTEGETLGAIVFSSFIDLNRATDALLDNMLRDELTGVATSRNIYSYKFTEIGLSLFAENLPLVSDQPFVYLLVVDFAKPNIKRNFMIGYTNVTEKLAKQNNYTGFWQLIKPLAEGLFQVQIPDGGAEFQLLDTDNVKKETYIVDDSSYFYNYLFDLRKSAE